MSLAVGRDLFSQVQLAEAQGERRVIVATGTSCQEQLQAGMQREIVHPMELLFEVVQPVGAVRA